MKAPRDGFGLIEVIIAMLILTVGVLAMGASTGFILKQVRASELRTERMLNVRGAAERLHSVDWLTLPAVCQSAVISTERYSVDCEVTVAGNLARIRLISTGPGYVGGKLRTNAVETTMMSIARPI
jgi:prepilin-type N-terminal cleavage/methylation domain-containing protein